MILSGKSKLFFNENASVYLAKKTRVDGKKIRTSDLFFWFPTDFFQISYVAHPLKFREKLIAYLLEKLPPEHEAVNRLSDISDPSGEGLGLEPE